MYNIERLELEFSNGVERVYQRLITSGLGAVIVVPMIDAKTVMLVREYLRAKGANIPVIAKIEKPEAIANIDSSLELE